MSLKLISINNNKKLNCLNIVMLCKENYNKCYVYNFKFIQYNYFELQK